MGSDYRIDFKTKKSLIDNSLLPIQSHMSTPCELSNSLKSLGWVDTGESGKRRDSQRLKGKGSKRTKTKRNENENVPVYMP